MDEFELELKTGFLEEASQLLQDVEQSFLILEKDPNDPGTIDKIFRLAHNLKGSSKAVGFDSMGAFTHEFESFLLKCKNGVIAITPATVSVLLKCTDHVGQTIAALRADITAVLDNAPLIGELHEFAAGGAAPPAAEPLVMSDEPPAADSGTWESEGASEPVSEFAPEFTPEAPQEPSLLEQVVAASLAPALAAVPPAKSAASPAPAASASAPAVVGAQAEESIRVSLARLEKLLNFVGELVILQTVLREQSYSGNLALLRKNVHQMGKVTKEVQELSMSLRMVPLKQTFQKMQRIVRDTSSVLGKQVNLILQGDETEVDKTVLEALSDPLVHLIRNAVDHGIESAEERKQAGKSPAGTVSLTAFHQSGKLVIEIRDDGAGISAEKLRQKAKEKGIIPQNANPSDQEAIYLVFAAGFSTKAEVTEVSGRGVGMDVVKTNIERMQGEVQVETEVGKGSVFRIVLPLTLAIIDGMVIRCGENRFVIPLSHVHESLKPAAKDIHKKTGMGEVLLLRGENLPVFRLSRVLAPKAKLENEANQIAVIVRTGARPFAAFVDDIIGQHQVVIKKLGAEVQHIQGFSGSAVLGDGKPALILELGDLVTAQRKVS